MKRFSSCICIILVAVLILAAPVNASESLETRASIFFVGSSVYLYKTSDTTFDICYDVLATGTMNELGAREIKVQRSSDGVNWITMKTWTKESYPSLICENTVSHAASVGYSGSRGYYYRAYIDLYAKNSAGIGSMSRYTSTIYIPTT